MTSPPSPATSIWYVTTHGGDDVLRYDADGRFLDRFVARGSGGLDQARGLHIDPARSALYVANSKDGHGDILHFNLQDGAFVQAIGRHGSLRHPYSIAAGPDGHLYVSSQNADTVTRIDHAAGAEVTPLFIPPGAGGIKGIRHAVFGPDGYLYVASRDTDQVLRFQADGAFRDVFVERGAGGLSRPIQLLFAPDAAGDLALYAGSSGADRVLRFHADGPRAGAFRDTFIDPERDGSGLRAPSGLALGPHDGRFYVASRLGSQVLRYHPDGSFDRVFIHRHEPGMNQPEFIVPVIQDATQ